MSSNLKKFYLGHVIFVDLLAVKNVYIKRKFLLKLKKKKQLTILIQSLLAQVQ